jgi:phosphoglycolate phosphatase-like HAD superfamily hydrolase
MRSHLFLFDIDGTLIGGDGSGRRAFERACLDCAGIVDALEHILLDGLTDPLIIDSVFQHHRGRAASDEEANAIRTSYFGHLEREVAAGLYHVKPAVDATLTRLEAAGATIGLATGNFETGARIKLTRGDLWRRFAFGGFGEDAPAVADGRSELVRVAIARGRERAGRDFACEHIFVIGDTPKDITAAHAAGARAVGVATGRFTVAELFTAGADDAHPTMAEWLATL